MVINIKECVLVTKGLVKEKSKGVVNFYKNGKQYYCAGCIENGMYFEECQKCKRWRLGDQAEEDYKTARKKGQIKNILSYIVSDEEK